MSTTITALTPGLQEARRQGLVVAFSRGRTGPVPARPHKAVIRDALRRGMGDIAARLREELRNRVAPPLNGRNR